MIPALDVQPLVERLLDKIIVPEQNLTQLSVFAGTKESHLEKWLQQLPFTQAHQVSAPLYTIVHELSRLQTSSEHRLQLLERLRLPVYQTLDGLAARYLNQPLILPESALKTATVAQAIQKHLLNGYLAVVRDSCKRLRKPLKKPEQLHGVALPIQRAITAAGQLLLRSYQLYLPVSAQVWTELHTLYRLARALGIERLAVEEILPHHRGIKDIHGCYLRVLLLATARPNQLRQDEIESTYKLLEGLASSAELDSFSAAGKENLFIVDFNSSHAPFYKSSWHGAADSQASEVLELRTTQLVQRLQDLYKTAMTQPDTCRLPNGAAFSSALAGHLVQAWTHLSMRSFERQEISTEIEVTVGLTNIHYHLAGEQPFAEFLEGSGSIGHSASQDKHSALEGHASAAFNTRRLSPSAPQDGRSQITNHPIHQVPLTDRSPGGYGLEWRSDIPVHVRAGELLGLREAGRTKWAIGVVRWTNQIKGATQLGVKILSPYGTAVGLAAAGKSGGYTEYLRALLIPELKGINQPHSLIANAISFHEYTKARLYMQPQANMDRQNPAPVQLTNRLFATGAFSQFAYRELGIKAKADETDNSGSN